MTRIVPGSRKRTLLVYGTRPELIKLAPVVFALRERPTQFEVVTCNTGQHHEMVRQVEEVFGVHPSWNLDLMQPDQSLNEFSSRAISAVDGVLRRVRPDLVIVQGDTTTVMVTSLAAFHLGISLGHVESGLRTGDLAAPFPEEANRRISDLVADLKFTPTRLSEEALLAEGHDPHTVYVTGNTIVDALLWVSGRLPEEPQANEVLVTLHRRETFGETLSGILEALRKLSACFPDTSWVFPVHKNPNIQRPVFEILGGLRNVALCDPMPYDQFIRHLKRARLVLTDSGGVQEETPTFRKPVLVLREKTERLEGLKAGVSRLVGTDPEVIMEVTSRLLRDKTAYRSMVARDNPFGDGKAAKRIAAILAGEDVRPFRYQG